MISKQIGIRRHIMSRNLQDNTSGCLWSLYCNNLCRAVLWGGRAVNRCRKRINFSDWRCILGHSDTLLGFSWFSHIETFQYGVHAMSICNGQQQMVCKTAATSHNHWLQCCKIWGLKSSEHDTMLIQKPSMLLYLFIHLSFVHLKQKGILHHTQDIANWLCSLLSIIYVSGTNNDCNFWHHLHDGSSCKETPLQSVSQSLWW